MYVLTIERNTSYLLGSMRSYASTVVECRATSTIFSIDCEGRDENGSSVGCRGLSLSGIPQPNELLRTCSAGERGPDLKAGHAEN